MPICESKNIRSLSTIVREGGAAGALPDTQRPLAPRSPASGGRVALLLQLCGAIADEQAPETEVEEEANEPESRLNPCRLRKYRTCVIVAVNASANAPALTVIFANIASCVRCRQYALATLNRYFISKIPSVTILALAGLS